MAGSGAHAIIPATPRGLLVMDGIGAKQVRVALDAFCKARGCTIGYRDDYGPDWRIYLGKQSVGSVAGPCGTFRWCLQTYDFPQANAFWTLANVAALEQAATAHGAKAYPLVCDAAAHDKGCVDGQLQPPEDPAKLAYANMQMASERSDDMRYQHGLVWIFGLPHARWEQVQPVIKQFCARQACYAVLNHVPADERFMFSGPGEHVPKPHWFIYSVVDNAWLGVLGELCPVGHADDYCLYFSDARGDAYWSHARVAQLQAAFDAAHIATDGMECWSVRRAGQLGAHDYCKGESDTSGH
jgi:hypothetical protein